MLTIVSFLGFRINFKVEKKVAMDFRLTEEHQMIRDAAREFARQDCLPGVIERDEHQRFAYDQIMKLGSLGFMGMMTDPAHGGAGLDTISYVLAMEEISKIDASVSVCMSVNNSLVNWGLETYGTPAQKQRARSRTQQALKSSFLLFTSILLGSEQLLVVVCVGSLVGRPSGGVAGQPGHAGGCLRQSPDPMGLHRVATPSRTATLADSSTASHLLLSLAGSATPRTAVARPACRLGGHRHRRP